MDVEAPSGQYSLGSRKLLPALLLRLCPPSLSRLTANLPALLLRLCPPSLSRLTANLPALLLRLCPPCLSRLTGNLSALLGRELLHPAFATALTQGDRVRILPPPTAPATG